MSSIRRAGPALLVSLLLSASMPTHADMTQEIIEEDVIGQPTYSHSVLDGLVARPLMLAGTVGGAALFVASLPFSIMGENVKGAANSLVVNPAILTFRRCLGCTVQQDELKNQIRATEAKTAAVATLWHWPHWVYRYRPVAAVSTTTTTAVTRTPAATNVDGSVVQIVMQ